MCDEDAYDDEPDWDEVAKDRKIERDTHICVKCGFQLHFSKEKGWYCLYHPAGG